MTYPLDAQREDLDRLLAVCVEEAERILQTLESYGADRLLLREAARTLKILRRLKQANIEGSLPYSGGAGLGGIVRGVGEWIHHVEFPNSLMDAVASASQFYREEM